jgi:predicted transcriptional regulator
MPTHTINVAEVEALVKEQEQLLKQLKDLLARMKRAFHMQDHADLEDAERGAGLSTWESTFASLS